MVRKPFYRTLALLAVLNLTACEIFSVTPFPDFVDKTDISIDLSHQIDAIVGGEATISYQLTVVDNPNPVFPPRVLLLVEPPSSDPTIGFNYKGKLIFMDSDLTIKGTASTGSSLDYFSRPYGYTHDNNVIAGYTVFTQDGVINTAVGTNGTLVPSGLEGFALTDGIETDVFATPPGQYASFDISYARYSNVWGIPPLETLHIIPPTAAPSASDPNYANLGYQLVGLAYNGVADEITFVLSEPAQGRIVAARLARSAAFLPNSVLLPSAMSWPVDASTWPLAVDVDRPALFADVDGFFMVRRDSWMERYTWNATGTPLAMVGDPVKIVGDRSLSRRYAFLVPQTPGPTYMYRFDPSSRVLTRYRRWW
jgi:hypothetical protein